MLLKTGDLEVLKHKRNKSKEELVIKEKYNLFTVSLIVNKHNIDYTDIATYLRQFFSGSSGLKKYFDSNSVTNISSAQMARNYFNEYEPTLGFVVTDNII